MGERRRDRDGIRHQFVIRLAADIGNSQPFKEDENLAQFIDELYSLDDLQQMRSLAKTINEWIAGLESRTAPGVRADG